MHAIVLLGFGRSAGGTRGTLLQTPAADDIDQQENDRYDKQDVQKAAERVLCHYPKEPENHENDDDADHVASYAA
jgi:hypothetical protein